MNALKKMTNSHLFAAGLLGACTIASAPVFADNDYRRGAHDSSRYANSAQYESRHNHRYEHRYDHRHSGRYSDRYDNNRRSGPVTIRLRYDANGSGRIPLKRLLRNQHGIDADNWRIRSVNVRHKSKRTAHARLNVGGHSTRDVYLRRGTTTIFAPRGDANGRWVLGFRNAKVRDVAVTLEPRGNRRGDRVGKYRTQRDTGYAYRSNRHRNQRALGYNGYRH